MENNRTNPPTRNLNPTPSQYISELEKITNFPFIKKTIPIVNKIELYIRMENYFLDYTNTSIEEKAFEFWHNKIVNDFNAQDTEKFKPVSFHIKSYISTLSTFKDEFFHKLKKPVRKVHHNPYDDMMK